MATNFRHTSKEGQLSLSQSLSRIVGVVVILVALASSVMADTQTSTEITATTTLEYYQKVPQNSPLDLYVHQGDTLYLGKTYDLSGASGISYFFAHWNNWKNESTDCHPDQIVDINYIRTLNQPRATLLSSDKWSVGNWYYWDWWECNITHYNSITHKSEAATGPLQADNKFAFEIVNPENTVKNFRQLQDTLVPITGYRSAYANKS
jgi:hypothetical protein